MHQDREIERRQHQRFRLPALYTSVIIEPRVENSVPQLCGHAYDISQSGVRIELDEPLEIGQSVQVHLELPGGNKDVHVAASVVWVNPAEDDPGPRRMALRFAEFKTPADEAHLMGYLEAGLHRHAA